MPGRDVRWVVLVAAVLAVAGCGSDGRQGGQPAASPVHGTPSPTARAGTSVRGTALIPQSSAHGHLSGSFSPPAGVTACDALSKKEWLTAAGYNGSVGPDSPFWTWGIDAGIQLCSISLGYPSLGVLTLDVVCGKTLGTWKLTTLGGTIHGHKIKGQPVIPGTNVHVGYPGEEALVSPYLMVVIERGGTTAKLSTITSAMEYAETHVAGCPA